MDNINSEDDVIDLLELFLFLKKKIWIIAIVFFAALFAGFFFSKALITPKYTASTRVYILNRSNENTLAYSDIQISSQFVNDYQELITGRNVTGAVISKMKLDMSDAEMKKKITVTSPNNTRILQINVEDTDPKRAADIANNVREIAAAQIQSIMDADSVRVVYPADVPTSPSSPNVKRNSIISAAIGTVLVIGIFVVIFLADDTIRSEEDVEKYLSLGVLGVVPFSKEFGSDETDAADKKGPGKKNEKHSANAQRSKGD